MFCEASGREASRLRAGQHAKQPGKKKNGRRTAGTDLGGAGDSLRGRLLLVLPDTPFRRHKGSLVGLLSPQAQPRGEGANTTERENRPAGHIGQRAAARTTHAPFFLRAPRTEAFLCAQAQALFGCPRPRLALLRRGKRRAMGGKRRPVVWCGGVRARVHGALPGYNGMAYRAVGRLIFILVFLGTCRKFVGSLSGMVGGREGLVRLDAPPKPIVCCEYEAPRYRTQGR